MVYMLGRKGLEMNAPTDAKWPEGLKQRHEETLGMLCFGTLSRP